MWYTLSRPISRLASEVPFGSENTPTFTRKAAGAFLALVGTSSGGRFTAPLPLAGGRHR